MSCLFIALAKGLNKSSSTDLRNEVVEYLKRNKPLFHDGLTSAQVIDSFGDFDRYIQQMSKTSTWGGGIEIRAVAQIYNVAICVHFHNKETTFLPFDNTPRPQNHHNHTHTIHISYTGSHYTFLAVT